MEKVSFAGVRRPFQRSVAISGVSPEREQGAPFPMTPVYLTETLIFTLCVSVSWANPRTVPHQLSKSSLRRHWRTSHAAPSPRRRWRRQEAVAAQHPRAAPDLLRTTALKHHLRWPAGWADPPVPWCLKDHHSQSTHHTPLPLLTWRFKS